MKVPKDNKDGSKSIIRSVTLDHNGTPFVKLIKDFGLGKGDSVKIIQCNNGDIKLSKINI